VRGSLPPPVALGPAEPSRQQLQLLAARGERLALFEKLRGLRREALARDEPHAHALEAAGLRDLFQTVEPKLRERAARLKLRLDLGRDPDDFLRLRVRGRVEPVSDGATLLVAELLHRRVERLAARRVDELREAHEVCLRLQ